MIYLVLLYFSISILGLLVFLLLNSKKKWICQPAEHDYVVILTGACLLWPITLMILALNGLAWVVKHIINGVLPTKRPPTYS